MAARVERRHREEALKALKALWVYPNDKPDYMVERWMETGQYVDDTTEVPLWYLLGPESNVAQAIADAEARGKQSTIDALRSHIKFYRDKQSELGALGAAGDLNARGNAYEYGLKADFVQELVEECEDGEG